MAKKYFVEILDKLNHDQYFETGIPQSELAHEANEETIAELVENGYIKLGHDRHYRITTKGFELLIQKESKETLDDLNKSIKEFNTESQDLNVRMVKYTSVLIVLGLFSISVSLVAYLDSICTAATTPGAYCLVVSNDAIPALFFIVFFYLAITYRGYLKRLFFPPEKK